MGERSQPRERIPEALRERLGEELRVVSSYSPEAEQVTYMRDDVREQYSREEDREILRARLLASVGHGRFTQLFGGELEATARIFERQNVTISPTGEQEGVLVSLEREGDYSYLDVVSGCERSLEQQA